VAARYMIDSKLVSVFSLRNAMRLNSFSLPKKFSIRWLCLVRISHNKRRTPKALPDS
jgi:hypothetical protein